MRLTKHHGLGNDFLITFAAEVPPDAPALARRLCHRHTGVGADGFIVLTPSPRSGVDAVMNLWNADGSVAEISGNGIRCVAQAIVRDRAGTGSTGAAAVVPGADAPVAGTAPDAAAPIVLTVETLAGDRRLVVTAGVHQPAESAGETPALVLVQVDMGAVHAGPPVVEPVAAPTVAPLRAATFDIGNPHLVVLVADPSVVDLAVAGPAIEAHYAEGINVHFIAPTGPDAIALRVWERGAGITAACGSGAVVAAHAAHQWGLVGERVAVAMPGGAAQVLVGDVLTLIGPSEFIADIEVPHG